MRRGLVWSLVGIMFVAIASLGATIAAGHTPLLGLDLRGGVQVVLQPQGNVHSGEIQQAVDIIERRVNGLGVSNSNVQKQGNDVTIDLPGIKDPQAALKILGETAQLLFRPAYCNILPAAPTTPAKKTTTSTTTPKSSLKSTPTTSAKSLGVSPLGPGSELAGYDAALPAAGTATTTPAATTAATTATTKAGSSTATTKPATTATTKAATTATTAPATTATTAPALTSAVNLTPAQAQAACTVANSATLPTTPVAADDKTKAVILPMYDNSSR